MINKNYIKNSKAFWNTDNITDAMFKKIVVGKKIRHCKTFKEKIKHWENETIIAYNKIIEDIPLKNNSVILEVGCGIGRLIKIFCDKGHYVDGVDISEKMIQYSKEYLKGNIKYNTYINNGYDLNTLKNNYYDFVYSYITFQHIRSRKIINSYIKEIHRVLKVGSYFKFQVHKYTKRLGNYKEEPLNEKQYGFYGNGYTQKNIIEMVSSFFDIIYIKKDITFNHLWILLRKNT